LAAVRKVRVAVETLVALADVASSAGCVRAEAVVATARVIRVSDCRLAVVKSDGPVKDHRRLSTTGAVECRRVIVDELRRGDVVGAGGRRREVGRVHEHREAAGTEAAAAVDPRHVQPMVEPYLVILQTLGDGRLAASHSGARV